MSALDVVSALSADSSDVSPLLDNVSPCMVSDRMAPASHGGKPVVTMSLLITWKMNPLFSQSLFSLRTAHLQEIVVISYP